MRPSRLPLTTLALLLAGFRIISAATPDDAPSWRQLLEKEWLLEAQCVRCHNPKADDVAAAKFDLTPPHAYHSLTHSGQPSLSDLVLTAYRDGVSTEGHNPAVLSAMLRQLTDPAGHHGVKLDRASLDRFVTWMDTYAQRAGTFSPEQEQEMERLRHAWADLLIEPAVRQAAARKLE